jgi:FtsZ-interacting cell division protein ZipA
MGNLVVIVFVLALLVWVVTNVIKAQQEDQKTTARRPGQSNTAARPSNTAPRTASERGTLSDIDRFLQEIDRLRQVSATPTSTEQQQQQQPPRPRPTPPQTSVATTNQPRPAAPRPRPVSPPVTVSRPNPPRPVQQNPEPVRQEQPRQNPTPVLQVQEVQAPSDREIQQSHRIVDSSVLPLFVAPPLDANLPTLPLSEQQLLGSTPIGVPTAGAAIIQISTPNNDNRHTLVALTALLKNPQASSSAAILLTEILGKPVCKRHGRRVF